jgi:hypothetical protein
VKSLLVHLGGLTFKKPMGSNELCLPNLIARRRVAKAVLSYYGLKEEAVLAAQDQFVLHDHIAPLLQLLTRMLSHTQRTDQQLNSITELQLEEDLRLLLSLPPNGGT